VSWVNELRLDMDNAVRLVEKTIRSRMPTMLRATGKPLSDREVGDISTLLAAAVARAIVGHDEELTSSINRK
jgi:hypothetical protein